MHAFTHAVMYTQKHTIDKPAPPTCHSGGYLVQSTTCLLDACISKYNDITIQKTSISFCTH